MLCYFAARILGYMRSHCICKKSNNCFCKFRKKLFACVLLYFGSTYKSLCVYVGLFVCCCCSILSIVKRGRGNAQCTCNLVQKTRTTRRLQSSKFFGEHIISFLIQVRQSQWQCCWVLHCSHPNILIPCGSACGPDVINGCGTLFTM